MRLIVILFFFAPFFLFSCESRISCLDLESNYLGLSNELRRSQDTLSVLKKLSVTIEKNPTCNKAYQLAGYLNLGIGNNSEAKKIFLKAIQLDSSNVYSLFYLGMICNIENNNAVALSYILKAKNIKEANGYILDINNDFADKFDIQFKEIIHMMGIILFEMKNFKVAKNCFLYCLKQEYYGYDTYGYLAALYSFENKVDSACYYHQKSILGGLDNVYDSTLIKTCD